MEMASVAVKSQALLLLIQIAITFPDVTMAAVTDQPATCSNGLYHSFSISAWGNDIRCCSSNNPDSFEYEVDGGSHTYSIKYNIVYQSTNAAV